MKQFLVALAMAVVYLVAGNIIAMYAARDLSNELLNAKSVQLLFAPYTFIAGMSEFAGWVALPYLLEAIIFIMAITSGRCYGHLFPLLVYDLLPKGSTTSPSALL